MSVVAPSPQPAFWTPMPAPFTGVPAAPTRGAPCYVYAAPPTAGVTGAAVHHAMPQAQATATPLPMPFPQQGFMPMSMPMPAPMQMPAGAVPVYPPTAPSPPPGWMYVQAPLTTAPQPQAVVDNIDHAPQPRQHIRAKTVSALRAGHPAALPPPPTPTYRAVSVAEPAGSRLAPWEPEAGVVDLRLLLLKSRDMRRKLRVSQRHAARPLHLRNHNEVVKVERRAEFTAQLAAMDEAARACGMLPATEAQVLLHAEVFASQGFHSLRRRRQRPSAASSAQSQDDGSRDDASRDGDDAAAAQTAAEMDDAWSTAAMRPLFLVAIGGHAQTPAANTDTTSDEGSVVSIAGAAVPPFDAARNFAAAVGDGAFSPGAVGATREAIHAALYRKFVLSAAHHANADAATATP